MIKSRLLSAALIAAAMFVTSAMARSSHGASRHLAAADAHAGVGASHVDGPVGIRSPRVGAHAAPGSAAATCDVGDSERIC